MLPSSNGPALGDSLFVHALLPFVPANLFLSPFLLYLYLCLSLRARVRRSSLARSFFTGTRRGSLLILGDDAFSRRASGRHSKTSYLLLLSAPRPILSLLHPRSTQREALNPSLIKTCPRYRNLYRGARPTSRAVQSDVQIIFGQANENGIYLK